MILHCRYEHTHPYCEKTMERDRNTPHPVCFTCKQARRKARVYTYTEPKKKLRRENRIKNWKREHQSLQVTMRKLMRRLHILDQRLAGTEHIVV